VAAPIVWFADMPADFHNPEPWLKIAGLRAAGHPVLFVDQLGVANPRPRNLGKLARYARRRLAGGRERGVTRPAPTLQLALVPPRHHRLTDALNDRLLLRQLRRRLVEPVFARPVLWYRFPTPELVRLTGRLGERLVVYECADRYESFGYPPRARRALVDAERRLLARADLVVATSEGLLAHVAPLARHAVLHRHGVDLERFARTWPEPAALAGIPRPRLGYTGPVDDRLDAALLATVARRHPEASVVVIGGVAPGHSPGPLAGLPNVHLLGPIPHAEMPAHVGALDVGVMPYRRTGQTRVGFPMKALEFLAAGLPCVAIDLPELARLSDVVRVCAGEAEFLAAVGDALGGRGLADPGARRAAVAGDAWPARAAGLSALVAEAIAEREARG
jgi:glycosyltransferase involved in cell wall biosynthesis